MAQAVRGNAVIGQSGGPTAVINQSLVGVIEQVKTCPLIPRLLGARHGVRGIVNEDFIDLKPLRAAKLELVANTPAAALGSTRDKPDEEYCRKMFRAFEKHDVRYFFYIGGNDSADTARIVNHLAGQAGYDLRVFHIPKTIDNDLRVTDHTPGYGSAARFVASAFMGEDRDNTSLPGVKISVVMGRHAGWLTAASTLGKRDAEDGPHLVYVPEVPFSLARFARDVREVNGRLGRCLIAVSEGIADRSGKPIAQLLAEKMNLSVERDSHGNIQLSGSGALGDFLSRYVREKVGASKRTLRVRADTYGYLQRSFAGYASSVDRTEARQAGRKAVEFALAGHSEGSVVFKRAKGAGYRISYHRAEIHQVARHTKDLPRDFINQAGNGITEGFRKYALPLVGGLPQTGKLP
jgi:6-phosphofructokinase 1